MLNNFRFRVVNVVIFSYLIINSIYIYAQVRPLEGGELNYRIIGFRVPRNAKAVLYKLEISKGYSNDDDNFTRNLIQNEQSSTNSVVAEVPYFGAEYTWRMTIYLSNKKTTYSAFYHFRTGRLPEPDVRLTVGSYSARYADMFVILDGSKVMYDMKGEPVWYMPMLDGHQVPARDIKVTHNGTLTFVGGSDVFEITYDGGVLWRTSSGPVQEQAPGGSQSNLYHHELVKLKNGHYMTLASEDTVWQSKPDGPGGPRSDPPYGGNHVTFGTVVELDKHGKEVWSWHSSRYFLNSDVRYYTPPQNIKGIDVHENAFYFDETHSELYVGFKNIGRIIKVHYPDNKVVAVYGEIYKPGVLPVGNGLFNGQHSISRTHDGRLLVFNNNFGKKTTIPTILKLAEPANGGTMLEKVWELPAAVDSSSKIIYQQGGNALELPDGNIMVCVGSSNGKTYITTSNGDVVWSGQPEHFDNATNRFVPYAQYRVGIVENRAQLEKMIWASTPLQMANLREPHLAR